MFSLVRNSLQYCNPACLSRSSLRALTITKLKEYYAILSVDKNSSSKEIKESFLRLSKIYHPDNNLTGSHEKFVLLKEAYDCLKNGTPSVTSDNPYKNYDDYTDLSHKAHARYREKTGDYSFRSENQYGFGGPYHGSSQPWEDMQFDKQYRRNQDYRRNFGDRRGLIQFTLTLGALAWIVIYSSVLLFWDVTASIKRASRNLNEDEINTIEKYRQHLREFQELDRRKRLEKEREAKRKRREDKRREEELSNTEPQNVVDDDLVEPTHEHTSARFT